MSREKLSMQALLDRLIGQERKTLNVAANRLRKRLRIDFAEARDRLLGATEGELRRRKEIDWAALADDIDEPGGDPP